MYYTLNTDGMPTMNNDPNEFCPLHSKPKMFCGCYSASLNLATGAVVDQRATMPHDLKGNDGRLV